MSARGTWKVIARDKSVAAGETIGEYDARWKWPHGFVVYVEVDAATDIVIEASLDKQVWREIGRVSFSEAGGTHVDYTGWQGRYPFYRFKSSAAVTVKTLEVVG